MKQGYTWRARPEIDPVIITAWHQHNNPALRRYKINNRPSWIMDFSVGGGAEYCVKPGRRWHTRPPKFIHLYPPRTLVHVEQSHLADKATRSACIIFKNDADMVLAPLLAGGARYLRFDDSGEVVARLMVQTAEIGFDLQENGFCRSQSMLWRIFALLLQSEPGEGDQRKITAKQQMDSRSDFVRAVDEILHRHISQRISLPEIASEMHISTSKLSHRYHQETQTTPMAKLAHFRINYAKGMLLHGDPLKIIADATGFSDAFHLSRVFKQITGVSPREFRSSHAGGTPSRRHISSADKP